MTKCPLCQRELIPGKSVDEHHLIPKTFKGSETVTLHKICHRKIHATFTERELEKFYNTIDLILENEEIQKFVKWVSKKDPEYYDISKETKDRKRKRGRR
jgi:hypothetical protein